MLCCVDAKRGVCMQDEEQGREGEYERGETRSAGGRGKGTWIDISVRNQPERSGGRRISISRGGAYFFNSLLQKKRGPKITNNTVDYVGRANHVFSGTSLEKCRHQYASPIQGRACKQLYLRSPGTRPPNNANHVCFPIIQCADFSHWPDALGSGGSLVVFCLAFDKYLARLLRRLAGRKAETVSAT